MTNSTKSFALAYLTLVLLPLLGLAGVLRGGRNLSAPVGVGGKWQFQADKQTFAALACGEVADDDVDPSFVIAQSGPAFTVTFADPQAFGSGEIQGMDVTARVSLMGAAARKPGCSGRTLLLRAAITPAATARTLDGTLSAANCPNCGAVEFHAARSPEPHARVAR